MELQTLIVLSCVLTAITMAIFTGFIVFLLRFGGQGVQGIWNRIVGGGNDQPQPANNAKRAQFDSQRVSSGEALRQRAKQIDFAPAPSGGQFNAQSTGGNVPPQWNPQQGASAQPQLPNLRSRGQYQQQQPNQNMPSLSQSRPYDPLRAPQQTQNPQHDPLRSPQQQQNQRGYDPLRPQQQQPPQQQQQRGYDPLQHPPQQQQQQRGYDPLRPQAPQQPPPQQQQRNHDPLRPQAPQQPPPPQQGGLGAYRPPISNSPGAPDDPNTGGLRRRRDSRRGDDHDNIYDDGQPDGGFGDILDL